MSELKINENIENRIYAIRGLQVMVDRDLAELYGVETKRLNEQVKRNIERFPSQFMFRFTRDELEYWKSQIATSNKDIMGLRKMPYAFTEQGVAMLSTVLKSDQAVHTSIQIMDAFVGMRKFIKNNAQIFQRLDTIERKQIENKIEVDDKFDKIFDAIESKEIIPNKGIFYNGQIFDAYKLISDIIRSANKSIVIIDNYIDDSVLNLLSKRKNDVSVTILTKIISKQLELDLKRYNSQYPQIEVKEFNDSHDRFVIIDRKDVFHIGASLKDLGKKWFAFSRFDFEAFGLLDKLKDVV